MMKTLPLTILLVFFSMLTACATNDGTTDTFTTPGGKEVVITAIKHASLRISYDGKEIEIDPVTKVGQETDYSKMPRPTIYW
jgi:hypothetical protein